MKKILLIGKNGQLGSEIMKEAPSFGFDIAGFEKEELDVTNNSQIKEKLEEVKPDILVNTSAYLNVPKCEECPTDAMKVNFLAVRNLAEFCKARKITFLTYSTDYVFDGKKGSPYQEDDATSPLQMYGLSKLSGEYAALTLYPEGTFIIRTCGLYGGKSGSSGKGGNFVLNIMEEAKGKSRIEISSEQIISPTYAEDLSKATLKLLKSELSPGVYHLINEGFCSWHQFAEEIFKIVGIKIDAVPIDRGGASGAMMRPKFSALKNTKAKAAGIELPSWQEGLKSYFNFLRQK